MCHTTTTITISTVEGPDERKNKSGIKVLPQFVAAFAAAMSAIGMGTVEAYTSPGLPSMMESGRLGRLDENQQANIASFALLAALTSGPPIGYLIGRIGRKVTLVFLAIPFICGWLLISCSTSIEMIYGGRFMTGFCAGAASLVVPIYIGEIAQVEVRGMLCSGFQLMVTFGNLFVYILGTYVDWQQLAFICGGVPLVGLLMLLLVPASPQYLVSKERMEDASSALVWLRGAKSPGHVEPELKAIQSHVEACTSQKLSFLKEITSPQTVKPMVICIMLLFFQQMTGIEAVLVYTVAIFKETGSEFDPHYSTILVGLLQLIATFFSAILVDKAGRRFLLMLSLLGTGISMLILAAFFYFKEDDPRLTLQWGWVPLASLAAFIVFFAVGVGPVPFLLLAELNSPASIGLASAAATTFNWTFAYLVTAFFIDVELFMGFHWCFGGFGIFSFLGVIFVYTVVPETKGISMEEIQKYFRKGIEDDLPYGIHPINTNSTINHKF